MFRKYLSPKEKIAILDKTKSLLPNKVRNVKKIMHFIFVFPYQFRFLWATAFHVDKRGWSVCVHIKWNPLYVHEYK